MKQEEKIHEIDDSPKTAASKARKVANRTRRKNKYECKCTSPNNKDNYFILRSTSKNKLTRIVDVYCEQYDMIAGDIKAILKG